MRCKDSSTKKVQSIVYPIFIVIIIYFTLTNTTMATTTTTTPPLAKKIHGHFLNEWEIQQKNVFFGAIIPTPEEVQRSPQTF